MKYMLYALIGVFILLIGYLVVLPLMPKNISDDKPLIMGVFPRQHPAITMENFTPMRKYLHGKLGRRIHLETTEEFKDFWENVKKGRYDIVHFNQYHYLMSTKAKSYEVFAMNEEGGKAKISGSIIVRKDSDIKSIMELKGRKVLFGGGPKAMQSYVHATYLLRQGGLKEGDYEVMFAKNPTSAIVSTYFGLWGVAAAGAGDAVLKLPFVSQQIDINQLQFLAIGEENAHLPWAFKAGLDPELKEKIKTALFGLKDIPGGKKVLKKANLTAILPAKDADFDPHRKIVKAVTGEEY